jgi:hypothetical protein
LKAGERRELRDGDIDGREETVKKGEGRTEIKGEREISQFREDKYES